MAGYILKAITKSPLKSKIVARCIPQPKQSKPKSCLFRQGSIKSSGLIRLIKVMHKCIKRKELI